MTVEDDRATAVTLGGDAGETLRPRYVVNATGPRGPRRGDGRRLRFDATDTGRHGLGRIRRPRAGGKSLSRARRWGHRRPSARQRGRPRDDGSVPVDDPDDYERADWEIERTVEERGDVPVGRRRASAFERGGASARCTKPTRPLAAAAASRGFHLLEHADGTLKTAVASSAGN